ncbi:MAG TPA: proton-conducting transporter membrane subunit, partial [Aggregatilineaceae bacterium]|nr:proton-conducting transporter membrane subunit [Aggregatilineaceae bacterium]
AVFKALLFLGAGAVIHTIGTRDTQKMGGVGRKMPFVRNVFVIGALALAGLPFLNGFWSKELLLDAGRVDGPLWAYIVMLAGAGLTGLYTVRCVWLVFYGKPRGGEARHDAPFAMRFSLAMLGFGTLTTWLLAGPLGDSLDRTLPYHNLHTEGTLPLVVEILTSPATWLGVAVVLVGVALWYGRAQLRWLAAGLNPIGEAAAADFGFEWLNRRVVSLVRGMSELLSQTQTGQLNWNLAGIVLGLILVVVFLAWKGTP